jgi:hypothetical protein
MKPYNVLVSKCYSVLAQMCTNNQHVSAYIASKHRLAMTNQYALIGPCHGVDWGIAKTLQMLLTDNIGLLDSVDETDVTTYVSLANDARDYAQFEACILLLTTMCEHAGKAFIVSQDRIREQIASSIPETRMDASTGDVEICAKIADANKPYSDWAEKWVPLHIFLAENSTHCRYIVGILRCLASISFNRRHKSQSFARIKFAPYTTAMAVIKDERNNDLVRAGFVKLVCRLYVDTDPLHTGFVSPDRVFNDICDIGRSETIAAEIAKIVPGMYVFTFGVQIVRGCFVVRRPSSVIHRQSPL